jgi:hypothetical protein
MLRALVQMRYLWQRPHQLDGQALAALLAGDVPHTPLPVLARALLTQAGAGAAQPGAPVRTAARPAG